MKKILAYIFILAIVVIAGVQAKSITTTSFTDVSMEQLPSAH